MWKANNYVSASIDLASDNESESETEDEDSDMRYIVGDVTHPQHAGDNDAIIIHCVGMCH